jgi:hypothetical protein
MITQNPPVFPKARSVVSSEVRQPPRPAPRLERGVSLAERIEQRHHAEPYQTWASAPVVIVVVKDHPKLMTVRAAGGGGAGERGAGGA